MGIFSCVTQNDKIARHTHTHTHTLTQWLCSVYIQKLAVLLDSYLIFCPYFRSTVRVFITTMEAIHYHMEGQVSTHNNSKNNHILTRDIRICMCVCVCAFVRMVVRSFCGCEFIRLMPIR